MRVGGSKEILQEIVQLFRQQECPNLTQQIRDALARGDTVLLERAAHTLTSSADLFGAIKALEAAQNLERMSKQGNLQKATDLWTVLEQELSRLLAALDRFSPAAET